MIEVAIICQSCTSVRLNRARPFRLPFSYGFFHSFATGTLPGGEVEAPRWKWLKWISAVYSLPGVRVPSEPRVALASRNLDEGASPRSPLPFESRKRPARPDSRNGEKSGKPERAFHRAEKLKACRVNNETESIGRSAVALSCVCSAVIRKWYFLLLTKSAGCSKLIVDGRLFDKFQDEIFLRNSEIVEEDYHFRVRNFSIYLHKMFRKFTVHY